MDGIIREEGDKWQRYVGKEISECKVGIIGYGRIGKLVAKKLQGFNPKEIYIHDINHDLFILRDYIRTNTFLNIFLPIKVYGISEIFIPANAVI